jgi:hypothetical protein
VIHLLGIFSLPCRLLGGQVIFSSGDRVGKRSVFSSFSPASSLPYETAQLHLRSP